MPGATATGRRVRQWLNFAVSSRKLAASPVSGTELVKPKPGSRDSWRQEQLGGSRFDNFVFAPNVFR